MLNPSSEEKTSGPGAVPEILVHVLGLPRSVVAQFSIQHAGVEKDMSIALTPSSDKALNCCKPNSHVFYSSVYDVVNAILCQGTQLLATIY